MMAVLFAAADLRACGVDLQIKAAGEGGAPPRPLGSRAEAAQVWALVEPHLLQDIDHISQHKGDACVRVCGGGVRALEPHCLILLSNQAD